MKKIATLFLLLLSVASVAQASMPSYQIMFRLNASCMAMEQTPQLVLPASVNALHDALHVEQVQKLRMGKKSTSYFYVARFPLQTNMENVLNAYTNCSEILYAEMDAMGTAAGVQSVVPNDPNYSSQWSLKNDGSFPLSNAVAGADVDMENAWSIEQGDSSVIVAIIDSGCKLDHPELAGRIWHNAGEIPNNNLDDDSNGLIDDWRGWDYAYGDNNPTDDMGHGTNVTGIIGTTGNNGIGQAGMDWNCKLMILKGIDANNSGFYSWWTSAIYYAVDNGCKVINMSVGGISFSATMQAAVDYALNNDVLVVACMMNTNNNVSFYPAAYTSVMAVGATNPDDTRAAPFFWSNTSGSNFGSHISVVAPGNYIYGLNYTSNTNYGSYWGGTSQAAPHTAGLAALLAAQDSSRTAIQIRTIIETTAEDQVGNPNEDVAGWDQYFGHGRINAMLALTFLTSTPVLTEKDEITIFPNPASGQVFVQVPAGEQIWVSIVDQTGRMVLENQLLSGTQLPTEGLAAGWYVVQIRTQDGLQVQKLILE